MPAVQRSEFALALNQVASERGVDVSVVLDTVKNAILAAYRKDHPGSEIEEFRAELNSNTGEAHIFHDDKEVTPPGFGRIAAQTAKQVILQKIREKEKEAILSDYRVRLQTIVNGMVLRFAGPNVIVDIGKTEAIMPVSEQITNEKYHLNQRLTVYLVEIREGTKGEEVVVSRSHSGLLEGLFKREVPEVAQGSVQIKAIEREAGNRSKVAVFSNQPGIDPVGSCVGQKGVRVQAIIQEFSGMEKIDIIQWSEDPATYIAQSLSPAKNVKVEIDEKNSVAHAFAPKEELSLAIGKEGQNVRLASKLTGYRIEIEGKEDAESGLSDGQKESVEKKEAVASEVKTETEEVSDEKKTVKKRSVKKDKTKAVETKKDSKEQISEESSVQEVASNEKAAEQQETASDVDASTDATMTDTPQSIEQNIEASASEQKS
ncbi:MAG TPA: transcription termination factor NusA [Patescibacteria group bacterium]|nr:transcription termination factor NusA [Patescibacteria group bacterium]